MVAASNLASNRKSFTLALVQASSFTTIGGKRFLLDAMLDRRSKSRIRRNHTSSAASFEALHQPCSWMKRFSARCNHVTLSPETQFGTVSTNLVDCAMAIQACRSPDQLSEELILAGSTCVDVLMSLKNLSIAQSNMQRCVQCPRSSSNMSYKPANSTKPKKNLNKFAMNFRAIKKGVMLFQTLQEHGLLITWPVIATHIPGRDSCQVRRKWKELLQVAEKPAHKREFRDVEIDDSLLRRM